MEDLFAMSLASRRQFLEQLAGEKEAALAEAPAGRLRCSTKDGIVQYYQVIFTCILRLKSKIFKK